MKTPVTTEIDGPIKIETFANGSIERKVSGETFSLTAPNPFGGTWDITFKLGRHNGAWRAEHIRRRGETWRPVPRENGWEWEKETPQHRNC